MSNKELDTSGFNCPIPIIKAKKELNGMEIGESLELISTDPGAVSDIESLCNALLNSAREPVKLLPVPPKSNVLFVSVSVVALPTRVSVALKNVIVLSAVGSTNATVVS